MSNLLYDKGFSSEDFRVAVAMACAALYVFPQEQWVEEEEWIIFGFYLSII